MPKDSVAFQEIRVLQNLSKARHAHDHLVSLLATYEQDEHICLILPWAEMDLAQYWENTDPRSFRDDIALSTWLRQQSCGLAGAVSHMHHYKTYSGTLMLPSITSAGPEAEEMPNRPQSIGSNEPRNRKTLFGRHGDIKPQNILWYPSASDTESSTPSFGILRLSDFGTAHFSDKEGVSVRNKITMPYSMSYQSPECRLPQGFISLQCDVWALGCVFLEFVCWYFGGHEHLQAFQRARERESGTGSPCFFRISCEEKLGKHFAEPNPPVTKVSACIPPSCSEG